MTFGQICLVCLFANAQAVPDENDWRAKLGLPPLSAAEFLERKGELHRWTHGARLTATAAVGKKADGKTDCLKVGWAIEYRGERPPMVVMEPSLERVLDGMTSVYFYAEWKPTRIKTHLIESKRGEGEMYPPPPTKWLIQIEKGKKASGVLEVDLGELSTKLQREVVGDFREPPPLKCQIQHRPGYRYGDDDAWVGELWSQVADVPLKKWVEKK